MKTIKYCNQCVSLCLGEEHKKMMSDLCDLAVYGQLKAKQCEEHSVEDFKSALNKAMLPYVGVKQLLNMRT